MKNRAFTLIELIVVIGIVALLSTLGLTTYNSVQINARNARRKADLREMQTALEAYKAKNNYRYPSTNLRWDGTCNPNPWGNTAGDTGLTGYIPGLAPDYINKLPRDPRENKTNSSSSNPGCGASTNANCYLYRSDGINYKLLAHCTPEGTMTTNDPFYDPIRTIWAWQVASNGTAASTW